MKLQLTFYTDTTKIDTADFTLRMKQLFYSKSVFGKFDLPDQLYCQDGVFRYVYFANDRPIEILHKFETQRMAVTQDQRMEIIYEMFEAQFKK
jgi:serine phosphatase RsbU (regulator of sigma subunit)